MTSPDLRAGLLRDAAAAPPPPPWRDTCVPAARLCGGLVAAGALLAGGAWAFATQPPLAPAVFENFYLGVAFLGVVGAVVAAPQGCLLRARLAARRAPVAAARGRTVAAPWAMTAEAVLTALQGDAARGLSAEDVPRRREVAGWNHVWRPAAPGLCESLGHEIYEPTQARGRVDARVASWERARLTRVRIRGGS